MTTIDSITNNLKEEGLSPDVINNLMTQMNNLIRCGPTCQKNNKIDELKKKYEKAQEEVHSAPERLNNARKNYYEYAYGDNYYQEYEGKKGLEKAKKMKKKIKQRAKEQMEELEDTIKNNIALKKSEKHLRTLLDKLNVSNASMTNNMDKKISIAKTSDRKVYYENEEIENMQFYKNILRNIYRFLMAVYVFLFFYRKKYQNKKDIIVILFFFISPYIIDYGVRIFLRQITVLLTYIPRSILSVFITDPILHNLQGFNL